MFVQISMPAPAAPDLRLVDGHIKVDGHAKMEHMLTADADVSDAEFRLIAAIRRHDWRDGLCRASQTDLATDCAKSERTVRFLVHSLKAKGLLAEENDPVRAGRARVYRLIGKAETEPQTGRNRPVYERAEPTQSVRFQPDNPAEIGRINRPISAGLKKTPVKTPEDGIPEIPEGEVDSPAPAHETNRPTVSLDGPPRPVPKPQALPSAPPPEPPPPPPPPRRGSTPASRPRTDPPETLEPSPTLRVWALEHRFTEAALADEIERCLDHHRIKTLDSGNWQSSLRTWLKNEVSYATEDGREPGVRVGKARPKAPARTYHQAGDGTRFRKDGSRIYTSEAGSAMPADLQALIDKNTRY